MTGDNKAGELVERLRRYADDISCGDPDDYATTLIKQAADLIDRLTASRSAPPPPPLVEALRDLLLNIYERPDIQALLGFKEKALYEKGRAALKAAESKT
jgi:hypothetical protein